MSEPTRAPRRRLSAPERRRQFLGIGLQAFVERPLSEVSLEDVARTAGVSSGLLFHYFPTKTDFYRAVVDAAARRVLRNVAPDEGLTGEAAVAQLLERYFDQIRRRRELYVALVYGHGPASREIPDAATAATLRQGITRHVVRVMDLPPETRRVVHAWVAFAEDLALDWSATATPDDPQPLIDLALRALASMTEQRPPE